MTDKEKAKAYGEAIERAKKIYKFMCRKILHL